MANSRYLRLSSMAFTVISASSDAIKKDFLGCVFCTFLLKIFYVDTGSRLFSEGREPFFWFDARIKYVILNMST